MTATPATASATATSTLDTVHVAPIVTAGGTVTFTAGGRAGDARRRLTVTDADSGDNLTGATVTIASGLIVRRYAELHQPERHHRQLQRGERRADADRHRDRRADYQTALDSITFSFAPATAIRPNGGDTARTISWTVTDGTTGNGSAIGTSTLATVHVGSDRARPAPP